MQLLFRALSRNFSPFLSRYLKHSKTTPNDRIWLLSGPEAVCYMYNRRHRLVALLAWNHLWRIVNGQVAQVTGAINQQAWFALVSSAAHVTSFLYHSCHMTLACLHNMTLHIMHKLLPRIANFTSKLHPWTLLQAFPIFLKPEEFSSGSEHLEAIALMQHPFLPAFQLAPFPGLTASC